MILGPGSDATLTTQAFGVAGGMRRSLPVCQEQRRVEGGIEGSTVGVDEKRWEMRVRWMLWTGILSEEGKAALRCAAFARSDY